MRADDHPLHGRPHNRPRPRLSLAECVGTALPGSFELSRVIMFFDGGSELAMRLPSAARRRDVLGPLLGAAVAIVLLRLEMLGEHRVQVARLFHFT